jgi:hypothetical protein
MGLAERRAIKEYQDTRYPELKKKNDAAAGFDVPMEIHWDKIAIEGEADRYNDDYHLTDTFFTPLIEALGRVAGDTMGKETLKDGLKKVVITYDPQTATASNYEKGWPFENGVLTINYQPGANSADHEEKVDAIVRNLEAGL